MRIFISYASEQGDRAEILALALRNEGNEVFFDVDRLTKGRAHHQVIREAIARSDLFIFLISPESIMAGRFALAELTIAADLWPSPGNRVLPVMLEPVPTKALPTYLRPISYLDPSGELVLDTCLAVQKLRREVRRRRATRFVLLAIAAAVVLFAAVFASVRFFSDWEVEGPDGVAAEFELTASQPHVSWGAEVIYHLKEKIPGSVRDYRCVLEHEECPNIAGVLYDQTCENIRFQVIDQPFVNHSGELLSFDNRNLSAGTHSERMRLFVTKKNGAVVWSEDITLAFSNSLPIQANLALEGLVRKGNYYHIQVGETYETRITSDKLTLPTWAELTVKKPRYDFLVIETEFTDKQGGLRLRPKEKENLPKGVMRYPHPVQLTLLMRHRETGWQSQLSFFFQVDRSR